MVGANVFDVQHFRAAHDRRLISTPVVESPAPQARRITASFSVLGTPSRSPGSAVGGRARQDVVHRLVRQHHLRHADLSPYDQLRHAHHRASWAGNACWFTASSSCDAAAGRLAGCWFDPLHARVRRYFIKAFLQSDAQLGAKGLHYNPDGLIAGDGELIRYFDWLASVPGPAESSCLTVFVRPLAAASAARVGFPHLNITFGC